MRKQKIYGLWNRMSQMQKALLLVLIILLAIACGLIVRNPRIDYDYDYPSLRDVLPSNVIITVRPSRALTWHLENDPANPLWIETQAGIKTFEIGTTWAKCPDFHDGCPDIDEQLDAITNLRALGTIPETGTDWSDAGTIVILRFARVNSEGEDISGPPAYVLDVEHMGPVDGAEFDYCDGRYIDYEGSFTRQEAKAWVEGFAETYGQDDRVIALSLGLGPSELAPWNQTWTDGGCREYVEPLYGDLSEVDYIRGWVVSVSNAVYDKLKTLPRQIPIIVRNSADYGDDHKLQAWRDEPLEMAGRKITIHNTGADPRWADLKSMTTDNIGCNTGREYQYQRYEDVPYWSANEWYGLEIFRFAMFMPRFFYDYMPHYEELSYNLVELEFDNMDDQNRWTAINVTSMGAAALKFWHESNYLLRPTPEPWAAEHWVTVAQDIVDFLEKYASVSPYENDTMWIYFTSLAWDRMTSPNSCQDFDNLTYGIYTVGESLADDMSSVDSRKNSADARKAFGEIGENLSWMGPADDWRGAYTRRLLTTDPIYLDIDDRWAHSSGNVRFTYLGDGDGTITMEWNGGSETFTVTNDNIWHTVTVDNVALSNSFHPTLPAGVEWVASRVGFDIKLSTDVDVTLSSMYISSDALPATLTPTPTPDESATPTSVPPTETPTPEPPTPTPSVDTCESFGANLILNCSLEDYSGPADNADFDDWDDFEIVKSNPDTLWGDSSIQLGEIEDSASSQVFSTTAGQQYWFRLYARGDDIVCPEDYDPKVTFGFWSADGATNINSWVVPIEPDGWYMVEGSFFAVGDSTKIQLIDSRANPDGHDMVYDNVVIQPYPFRDEDLPSTTSVITLEAVQDTYISRDHTDTNYYDAIRNNISTNLADVKDEKTILYFDKSSVPVGASIESATLHINVASANVTTVNIYNLIVDSIPTETTWTNYAIGQRWDTQGANGAGDRDNNVMVEHSIPATLEERAIENIDVTPLVAAWLSNSATTGQFLIEPTGTGRDVAFHATDRETVSLEITYSEGPPPDYIWLGDMDTTIKYDDDGNYGSLDIVNVQARYGSINHEALIDFDYTLLPDEFEISEAYLDATLDSVSDGTDPLTAEVVAILPEWDAYQADWIESKDGSAWETAGAFGANDVSAPYASTLIEATQIDEVITWDITDLVKDWKDTTIWDRGILIRPSSTTDTARYNFAASGHSSQSPFTIRIYGATVEPTPVPTDTPTATPVPPTDTPTPEPVPTDTPTTVPTDTPTVEPTDTPTTVPTDTPTSEPTDTPTTEPTSTPTVEPAPDCGLLQNCSFEDLEARIQPVTWFDKLILFIQRMFGMSDPEPLGPGYEDDFTWWGQTADDAQSEVRQSNDSRFDDYSLYVKSFTPNDGVSSPAITVNEGDVMEFTFWYKTIGTSGNGPSIHLAWSTGPTNIWYPPASEDWTSYVLTDTVPSGISQVYVAIHSNGSTQEWFADGASFVVKVDVTPTPTPIPTDTPTSTPTETDTPVPVPTDTPTSVPPTDTPTAVPTDTPTGTPVNTPTNTPTSTPGSPTGTPTIIVVTLTPTAGATPTPCLPTVTATHTPTITPTSTPVDTPTPTNTPSPIPVPTDTPTITPTPGGPTPPPPTKTPIIPTPTRPA